MVLGVGFCHVTLAPNFSFSLRRLEDESAEQQFRRITMAAALMGLLAAWESASRASDLNTASSTLVLSWGFWEPPLSSTPRSSHVISAGSPKEMPLLQLPLIVEEQMHGQNTPFWMASWLGSLHVAPPARVAWELSRSCRDDAPLGSATAQALADSLPSQPSPASPKPLEKGQSPAYAEACCIQDVLYLCCGTHACVGQAGIPPTEDYLRFDHFQT